MLATPYFLRQQSGAFDTHCNAHAAADAKRSKTFLRIPASHFINQRRQDARAGCPDGMADCDRPAIDIDLFGIEFQRARHHTGLRRKRLIRFDKIKIGDAPVRFGKRFSGSRYRPGTHDLRIHTGCRPGRDTDEWFETTPFRLALAHEHKRSKHRH